MRSLQPEVTRAALLDLDGTLVDSLPDLHAAVNAVAQRHDLNPASLDEVRSWIGKGSRRLIERLLQRDGRPESEVDAALASFFAAYQRVNGELSEVYPGVLEGLDSMRSRGLRLACVTNKVEAATMALLARMALSGYFEVVIGGSERLALKPAPAPLLAALSALGATPAQGVMIGDSANDLEAARAAGCRCLLLPYGYSSEAPVQSLGADAIVPSLVAASDWIAANLP